MKRLLTFLCLSLFTLACSETDNSPSEHLSSPSYMTPSMKAETYARILHRLEAYRDSVKRELDSSPDISQICLVSSRKHLESVLVDSIFPLWVGTPWDYNGISETPGHGEIACGYFVTTCLRDCGFKIERVKLAQQTALIIMKTVSDMTQLRRIGHNDLQKLLRHIKSCPDGLFILGLDNHVGFVYKKGSAISMIHSNGFRGHSKVEVEQIEQCDLVKVSENYFIAPLFTNDHLIMKWIHGHPVTTAI